MKASDFYTREKGNKGVKLPLYTPEGTATEHYLEILSVDSDAFQMAQSEMQRDLATANLEEDKTKRFELVREAKVAAAAALVIGWSLEDDFNQEAVKELLVEAPQLVDQIDRAASNRALFFASGSKSSSIGPAASSGSTKSRKGVKKASASNSSRSKKQQV
ncbi:phage tail assembly chaperone [Microbulbifer sp. ANSA001]|uniref:phage tail assembly chaperone n=1 Tax=Microbulbifer sp. ANSA001 TaxID=3243358 RepID=UPI0040421210